MMCNKLSLEQLDQLKGYSDDNVVGARFQKMYSVELSEENQQILTNDEKYQNLTKLYQATVSEKLPRSLQMSILG
jgi:hypothetical protein